MAFVKIKNYIQLGQKRAEYISESKCTIYYRSSKKEIKVVRKEFLEDGSLEPDLKGSVGLKQGRKERGKWERHFSRKELGIPN